MSFRPKGKTPTKKCRGAILQKSLKVIDYAWTVIILPKELFTLGGEQLWSAVPESTAADESYC